jgi:hypothetical protein
MMEKARDGKLELMGEAASEDSNVPCVVRTLLLHLQGFPQAVFKFSVGFFFFNATKNMLFSSIPNKVMIGLVCEWGATPFTNNYPEEYPNFGSVIAVGTLSNLLHLTIHSTLWLVAGKFDQPSWSGDNDLHNLDHAPDKCANNIGEQSS